MEHTQEQPERRCKHCGTALTSETTGGLCPRCLLEMNFASRTMPGGEPSPQVPPPSPEEMAARFPQFEILECLGRGGMGIVYKARQKTLDRLVAIKVLAGERRDDPQFEERFLREARTLAKLNHPNIVTVHEFGESDGMFYLVMEFVDGVNLRDVLHDGRMEPAEALAVVPEICGALQFAHDHGVVHRDIKPENILMDRDGRVKIADFGIAALIGADADHSGTPPYMAPEQRAAGGTIDHRADIYALGVVFYEMLTGERPERDPSRPSQRVEVDVRLDEIVLRALEREPARRYQTAGEFRTVVETMVASSPAEGAPHARDTGTEKPAASPTQAARFSRTAIIGALWAAFFFFLPVIWHFLTTWGNAVAPVLGLTAPFGTTILGCVALTQIRRSAGRLYGLGLAMFDALLFPMLVLNALILWLVVLLMGQILVWGGANPGTEPIGEAILPAALIILVANFWLARWAWRSAKQVPGGPSAAEKKESAMPWAGIAVAGSLLLLAGAVVLMVVIPRQWQRRIEEQVDEQRKQQIQHLRDRSHSSPAVPAGSKALATQIEARLREAVEKNLHGNAGTGGRAKFVIFKSLAVKVSPDLRTATVHLTGLQPTETSPGSSTTRGVFQGGFDVHYAGGGTWEVTGTGGLAGRRFTVQTVDLMGIPPAGTTPEAALQEYMGAAYSGDVERALSMIGGPLGETPEEAAKVIRIQQVISEENAQPPEPVDWHKEGAYAATRFAPHPGGPSPISMFVILERFPEGWKLVGTGCARKDSSSEDNLRTFQRFRLVDRSSRNAVAQAFIEAVGDQDFELATMLAWRPMSIDPNSLASEFRRGNLNAARRGPAIPLRWIEDGPYALTRGAFFGDEPGSKSYLALKRTEGIWRVVWANGSSPDSSPSDDLERFKHERMVGRVMVEDLALRFLVAIREKDEKSLRELCVDRTEGWTEALVGHFAMELRERFRQQTGEEFALYPDPSAVRVDADLGVVVCRAFRDVQKKLKGNILVLHFCRTDSGWKVWTLRKAPESQSLDDHLKQARKWAAEWEKSSSSAEGTVEEALPFDIFANIRSHDNILRMRIERREQQQLVHWMDTGIKTLETKLLKLTNGTEAEEGTRLRIRQHAQLREAARQGDWKKAEEVYSKIADKGYVQDLHRVLDTSVADPASDSVTKLKALPVIPPAAMPKDSPLTVEQVAEVLDGVSWGELLAAFADDGHGDEVSWKEVEENGGNGRRFEVTFTFGGEKMLLDLEVDPEFQQATPSRLRSAENPGKVKADPAEFMPQMVTRFAVQSNHPAAAPAIAKLRERALQAKDLGTMREYITALLTYKLDAGSLPPKLEVLVGNKKKFLRELMLMENHATGDKEKPLYHGGPEFRVEEFDASKWILLAAPSPDGEGKRIVGFVDGSVRIIDEVDYQAQLKRQRKPPMERSMPSKAAETTPEHVPVP